MRHRPIWLRVLVGALLFVAFVPCLACGGLGLWITRPRPWQTAAAAPMPQLVWHGTPTPEQGLRWAVALALDAYRPARQVDLFLGQAPADLAMARLSTAQIVGSITVHTASDSYTTVWLDLPADDQALNALRAHLAQQGWYEPRWARLVYRLESPRAAEGGFASPTPPAGATTRFLCGPQDQWAELKMGQSEPTRLLVQLNLHRAADGPPPPCRPSQVLRWLPRGPAWPRLTRVPALNPPPGVETLATSTQPWETNRYFGHAWLQGPAEALHPATLLDAYAAQLRDQGWRLHARHETPDAARSQWIHPRWFGPPWHLDLAVVHDLPNQATAWMFMYPEGQPLPPDREPWSQSAPRVQVHAAAAAAPRQVQQLLRALWASIEGPDARIEAYAGEARPQPQVPWPEEASPIGMYVRQMPWGPNTPERIWVGWSAVGPETLQDQWATVLESAGWRLAEPVAPDLPVQGLLGPNLPLGGPPPYARLYCHPDDGRRVHVRLLPTQNQGTWLMLTEATVEAPCPIPARPLAQPPSSSRWPTLRLPDTLPRWPGGGWGAPNSVMGEILWVAAAEPQALRQDLDAQLEAQGWQRVGQGAALDLAWSVWQPRAEPQAWLLRLYLGRVEDSWTWIALALGPAP